jgi:hypothetical protein
METLMDYSNIYKITTNGDKVFYARDINTNTSVHYDWKIIYLNWLQKLIWKLKYKYFVNFALLH